MEFRIAPHTVLPGVDVVEVWNAGVFVGLVCPADDGRSIKVISKYATGDVVDESNRLPNRAADGRFVRSFTVVLGG